MKLIEKCLCGNTTFENKVIHNIPIAECTSCHVMHQDLDMTKEQYFDFYKQKYHGQFQTDRGTSTYSDRYDHDVKISEMRYNEYVKYLKPGTRALDIGSSNNAFINTLRSKGILAFGVEIGEEGKKHPATTYTDDLLDIGFPPSYFEFITLHDVLEHFIDPIPYLKELHSITSNSGFIVVDFPNFFDEAGKHHWKTVEHLWMLNETQLTNLFKQHGFNVLEVKKPIPSKIVFYLSKIPVAKKKLMFMSGMGDIYWCLTKAESFIKKHGLGECESYIFDMDGKRIGNKQRSENFLDKFPWMEYKGVVQKNAAPVVNHFYLSYKVAAGATTIRPGGVPKWLMHGFEGFDYTFNMNGILELGQSMVTGYGLENYDTNWQPKMFESIEEKEYQKDYVQRYGKYVFGYFTGTGAYEATFNRRITPALVVQIAEKIYAKTGAKLVITGTTWDADNTNKIKALDTKGIVISELNNTTTSQLLALMKGSVAVLGWPAGNTIVAASIYKKPAVIIWSRGLWHEGFAQNCVDLSALRKTYYPLYVEDFTANFNLAVDVVSDTITAAINGTQPPAQALRVPPPVTNVPVSGSRVAPPQPQAVPFRRQAPGVGPRTNVTPFKPVMPTIKQIRTEQIKDALVGPGKTERVKPVPQRGLRFLHGRNSKR